MTQTAAIIPAGGAGLRMGLETPKQFHMLDGIPILVHTLRVFQKAPSVGTIIVAVPEKYLSFTLDLLHQYQLDESCDVVVGGTLRQDSVRAGLYVVEEDAIAVVHDAVRPFITVEMIERCVLKARETGAAMLAVPVKDTLKAVEGGRILRTIEREGIWQAQTPQAMQARLLRKAFAATDTDGFVGTDEASLLEHIGVEVSIVEGSEKNIKLTRLEDLQVAEALLLKENGRDGTMNGLRIGQGFDAHRLVQDRPLVLGGVTVDHDRGLLGHSDADVLTHAFCDAILGALGLGDIGNHFPDTDPDLKGIDSLKLLARVMDKVVENGYKLINGDLTLIAQAPKLAPFIPEMRGKLAVICGVTEQVLNIKATTTEKMGFTGREEGIAAQAVVLLSKQ